MYEPRKKWTEAEKQNVIDKLWLQYFNDTLYDKGLISEDIRNRMRNQINRRKPGIKRTEERER